MEIISFVNQEFALPSSRKQSETNRGVIKNIFQDYQTIEFSWTTIQNKTRHELQLFCEGIDGQYIFTEFSELSDIGAVVPQQIATYIGPLRMLGIIDGHMTVPIKGIISVQVENKRPLPYSEYLAVMAKLSNLTVLPTHSQIVVYDGEKKVYDLTEYVKGLKTVMEQYHSTVDLLKRSIDRSIRFDLPKCDSPSEPVEKRREGVDGWLNVYIEGH